MPPWKEEKSLVREMRSALSRKRALEKAARGDWKQLSDGELRLLFEEGRADPQWNRLPIDHPFSSLLKNPVRI
jgi:hypothetical protein